MITEFDWQREMGGPALDIEFLYVAHRAPTLHQFNVWARVGGPFPVIVATVYADAPLTKDERDNIINLVLLRSTQS